nr:MAG TPA: hypothetical protein [Caudoviricetes sp.]
MGVRESILPPPFNVGLFPITNNHVQSPLLPCVVG